MISDRPSTSSPRDLMMTWRGSLGSPMRSPPPRPRDSLYLRRDSSFWSFWGGELLVFGVGGTWWVCACLSVESFGMDRIVRSLSLRSQCPRCICAQMEYVGNGRLTHLLVLIHSLLLAHLEPLGGLWLEIVLGGRHAGRFPLENLAEVSNGCRVGSAAAMQGL